MMKPKTKKRLIDLGLIVLFLAGMGIFAYPAISQFFYEIIATDVVNQFEAQLVEVDTVEIDERKLLAEGYNQTLDPSRLGDPFTDQQKEGIAEYARMLEVNEMLGHVMIQSLGLNLPIYAGTSETVLQKGVGHLEGTSLPIGGIDTHSVLTAHRGLPNAKLFTDLDKMKEGDKFYVRNIFGVLAYEVDNIKVVEPSALHEVLVVPDKDYVTLLTCTPYMINSHRLLVRGHRIDYVEPIIEKEITTPTHTNKYKLPFLITLSVLVLVLVIITIIKITGYLVDRKHKKSQ